MVLWNVAEGSRLTVDPLVVPEGPVRGVAFSPDGTTLAAGYGGGSSVVGGVVLWDVAKQKRLCDGHLPVTEGAVRGVAFSPEGTTLAAGYRAGIGGGVVLWNMTERKRQVSSPVAVPEGVVESVALHTRWHDPRRRIHWPRRRRSGTVGRARPETSA